MILAELEVYHSRPVAPTRRVALGRMELPVDPPPGFGGILLGGVIANNVGLIDPDLLPDLAKLTTQLENGLRVPQPRLRYRFQKDRVGLQSSRHRLLNIDDTLSFSFDDEHGHPAQQVLGAVYAAGELPLRHRRAVMGTIRRAIGWQGPVGPELITALAGFNSGASWSAHALTHPVEWAMEVLGWSAEDAAIGAGRNGVDARRTATNGVNGHQGHNGRNGHNGKNGHNGSNGANGNGADRAGTAADRAGAAGRALDGRVTIDGSGAGPSRTDIQRRYRQLLIEAHPDHGGESEGAAQRIADLTEARRILLG